MEISVSTRDANRNDNNCRIVAVHADGKLKGSAASIDKASGGLLKRQFKMGDFNGKVGQTLLLHAVKGSASERVLLVGFGERKLSQHDWLNTLQAMAENLVNTGTVNASSDILSTVSVENVNVQQMAEQFCRTLSSACYRFSLHPRQSPAVPPALQQLTLIVPAKLHKSVNTAARRGVATANGMALTRDLGNLAPNICTPIYLEQQALQLAQRFDRLSTTAIDEIEMQELGMGAFLAVSQGSEQPGRLLVMNYQGRKRAGSPIVLVGKGVTFDTGGISIKSSDGMDEMKYDMCGAATVYGVMQAVAELDLELNVIGVIAAAENMPDGKACKPGDVVTSMSGQSIEILNTDAEGRLVLCDALTYVERFKPAAVIDMATLTGACIVALGNTTSAVMGNNSKLTNALLDSGTNSGDHCWQLPLLEPYQRLLDSNFADIANIGGRAAGAITAGCFLSRFASAYAWAHLDIAGIAWHTGKQKGASGRPVPLLMDYLCNRAD